MQPRWEKIFWDLFFFPCKVMCQKIIPQIFLGALQKPLVCNCKIFAIHAACIKHRFLPVLNPFLVARRTGPVIPMQILWWSKIRMCLFGWRLTLFCFKFSLLLCIPALDLIHVNKWKIIVNANSKYLFGRSYTIICSQLPTDFIAFKGSNHTIFI